MKTLEEVLNTYESKCLDSRDLKRLVCYCTWEQIPFITEYENISDDLRNKESWMKNVYKEWTKENILQDLKRDVAFGFEKALNKRGISAGLMFNTVLMWNQILEDGLENWDEDHYAMYGLPLFKATAEKYGFDNPIGNDTGEEDYYNNSYDEYESLYDY